MKWLEVKNWRRFQHYKDRRPEWIKLYSATLDDYAVTQLSDSQRLHLTLIWLLAARNGNDGILPADPKWIRAQIHAHSRVRLEPLIAAGFLTIVESDSRPQADCKQTAIPETDVRTETETDPPTPQVQQPFPTDPPAIDPSLEKRWGAFVGKFPERQNRRAWATVLCTDILREHGAFVLARFLERQRGLTSEKAREISNASQYFAAQIREIAREVKTERRDIEASSKLLAESREALEKAQKQAAQGRPPLKTRVSRPDGLQSTKPQTALPVIQPGASPTEIAT